MTDSCEHPDLTSVALFPLPNVVLFPRAVLPLHIFEERYKQMTADALAGDRTIAMALLRAGWEKSYYGRPPIEPVVCVGKILTHEKLPDGKYNFLLQGTTRARVTREDAADERGYRIAQLQPMEQTRPLEIDLSDERERMMRLFDSGSLARTCLAKQFRQFLTGAVPLPTADVADLIAFYLLEDVALKQSLLAECETRSRVLRTLDALEEVASHLPVSTPYIPPAAVNYSLKHPDMN